MRGDPTAVPPVAEGQFGRLDCDSHDRVQQAEPAQLSRRVGGEGGRRADLGQRSGLLEDRCYAALAQRKGERQAANAAADDPKGARAHRRLVLSSQRILSPPRQYDWFCARSPH